MTFASIHIRRHSATETGGVLPGWVSNQGAAVARHYPARRSARDQQRESTCASSTTMIDLGRFPAKDADRHFLAASVVLPRS